MKLQRAQLASANIYDFLLFTSIFESLLIIFIHLCNIMLYIFFCSVWVVYFHLANFSSGSRYLQVIYSL